MSGLSWSAELYAENARFVAVLGAPLVDLLKPLPGERILDLGCGDGLFTRKVLESGAQVVGVDSSADLVQAAQAGGIDARVVDGERLAFKEEFDAVISNAALHWMLRADDVIAGVRRALRPGGRFVAEFGGHGNIASIHVALTAVLRQFKSAEDVRSPWYFPSAAEYAAKLEQHGFVVDSMQSLPRPTVLPTGMEGWLAVFAEAYLGGLAENEKTAAIAEVLGLLKPVLCDASGTWTADYVRLRFVAHLSP